MVQWTNWSGRIRADVAEVVALGSEADAVELVRRAAQQGMTVRVAGATHSHAPLVANDGGIVATSDALSGLVDADAVAGTATLRAGTRIFDIGRPLRDAGLALRNQGDIDQQAIAGAVATGTHGTGPTLQSLSASVRAMRIVTASGDIVTAAPDTEPELFEASRLSLGALGIVTEVTLAVRDAYRLSERRWLEPLDDVMDRIDELTAATRHFEYFWYPGNRRAICKAIEETDAEPVYPLGEEGTRTAWSDEVLPSVREDRHTEMEYSVPAQAGPACLAAIRDLLATHHRDVAWPIEYRTLAPDDVWLSTARGRDTVTISIHEDVARDEEPYYRAAEEIFRSFDGRPHWGKVTYLDGGELASIHDRWEDWWRVRDDVDPDGMFLNDRLRAIAP